MKQIVLLCSFLFIAQFSKAQIVNIPDAAFKSALLSVNPPIDTNSDGEIQVSEALARTTLYIQNRNFADVTGINSFANLQQLIITNNNLLTTLDVSNLTQLYHLVCYSNQLSTLNLGSLTSLTTLECSSNYLTSLNLLPLTNLRYLYCSFNPLGSLDVSTLSHLVTLGCSGNNLTTLDVSNLINLSSLGCSNNQLTEINLQNQTNLTDFDGSNNLFTEIDLSRCATTLPPDMDFGFIVLNFSENPNLMYINIKNDTPYAGGYTLYANNCPQLRFICANENRIDWTITNLQINNNPDSTTPVSNVQVNSYCSFAPTGDHNTITGNLNFDYNNNGCDVGDIVAKQAKLFLNNGFNTGAAFTNNSGEYTFYTQQGNFTVTPNFQNSYFTVSPASATVNFANDNNNTQIQNFCITPLGIHNDLEILAYPAYGLRPGFDAYYILYYKNKGNQILSGSINYNFDDAVLDFVSASPMTSSQTLNNLNWSFTDLLPFESRIISFVLNVNAPTDNPPVNLDDVINATATISPVSNDETPEDNVMSISEIASNSFDPNDKTCLEGNTITPDMVGRYLNYVIRFQNSGTAPAENVVVKDMIDTTKFDISSLQLTGSSHPNVARVTGNKVEFIFEDINLPAEIDNEPGSHGYVAFKIKTKNNLVLGNVIQNTANIYFDFNFPIVTNTTSTTVSLLNINDFDSNSVSLTPIPVNDILQIKALETIRLVQLFDIQGRLLQTITTVDTNASLDFTAKPKGVYVVKVHTEKGMKVQKVIKG